MERSETLGRSLIKEWFTLKKNGGEGGIRTLDAAQHHIHDFQSCAFNRSATSPLNFRAVFNRQDNIWRRGRDSNPRGT